MGYTHERPDAGRLDLHQRRRDAVGLAGYVAKCVYMLNLTSDFGHNRGFNYG